MTLIPNPPKLSPNNSDPQRTADGEMVLGLLVSRDEYEWLEQEFRRRYKEDYEDLKSVFVHVLALTLRTMRSPYAGDSASTLPWIPMSSQFVRSHFRKAEWKRLAEEGIPHLLQLRGSVHERCAHVRLPRWFLRSFASIPPAFNSTGGAGILVDAVTGIPHHFVRRRTLRDRESEPVRGALKSLPHCIVNISSVESYLKTLYDSIDAIRPDYDLINSYISAMQAYRFIVGQARTAPDQHGLLRFHQAYTVTGTGRISALGMGVQCCPGSMKKAAFREVPSVFMPQNYDIRSSQMAGLIELAEHINSATDKHFDVSWVRDYLEHSTPKAHFAALAGFDDLGPEQATTAWKRCLYALMYGASTASGNAIDEILSDYYEEESLRRRRIEGFRDTTARLAALLRATRGFLKKDLLRAGTPKRKAGPFQRNCPLLKVSEGGRRGGHLIWNACNKALAVETSTGSQLLAHLLQGLEAAFIHHLTILCGEHGISVLSNQHDGLVIDRAIPERLIEEARRRSGFASACLELKPF